MTTRSPRYRPCADCGVRSPDRLSVNVKVDAGPRIILCPSCLSKRNAAVVG